MGTLDFLNPITSFVGQTVGTLWGGVQSLFTKVEQTASSLFAPKTQSTQITTQPDYMMWILIIIAVIIIIIILYLLIRYMRKRRK